MVSGQNLPPSAEAYQAAQRREMEAALRAVERQWSLLPDDDAWIEAWSDSVEPRILATLLVAQGRLSDPTEAYISRVLRETGQGRYDDPIAQVRRRSLVGTTGDGRTVAGLVSFTPAKVFEALDSGAGRKAAFEAAQKFLNLAAMTAMSDTARQAETLHTAVRPGVSGYVRMLNPPSCSRCAVLAGRWYGKNQGFLRHPGCDCRHIPAGQAEAGDLRLDPQAYFESLPTAAELAAKYPDLTVAMRREAGLYSQEDIFTGAGAKVIRSGADPVQVVNARRGMTTSQTLSGRRRLAATERYGQQIYVTTEGTTVRGRASRRRAGRNASDRLMPESIVTLAEDEADLLRLLRVNGYIA